MQPLYLPAADCRYLLDRFGPSLGLWRAAEVAALREVSYEPPVLDLGCGDGIVTSMVLPRVELGVDPNARAIERARATGVYERLEAVPVERLALPTDSFGTIVGNSVLEHIPNLEDALSAAARLLRPGGKLVLTTPTRAFGRQLLLPLEAYGRARNRRFVHLNLYTSEEWRELLRRCGLEVESVRPYMRPPLVALWDALELTQQIYLGRRRLFSLLWRRLPEGWIDDLAQRMSRLDLASDEPGGGQLIVARKV